LETDHQQGVQVRALIDPSFAYRPYSEGLDMMGVSLGNNCKYEADNHPWQQTIATVGVPQLLKGDLLHHKFGVIDQQTVITGSHNWSEAANSGNDETVLVIQNSTVAAHYQREFERLYANARLGLPDSLQKKIQLQKQCSQLPITSRPVIANSNRNSVVPIPNESKYQVSQKLISILLVWRN
jgi:phosphatidylserine/phosphatidylglycerophosphate/cardiolipin synthase-like enzyme